MFKRSTNAQASALPMQAIAVRGDGKDYRLELAETLAPEPKPHEVRIRVAYAGVNRADIVQACGQYPPPSGASEILGLEVSGEIEALGSDVTGWSVGERVCALTDGGAYAQFVCVPGTQLLSIPPKMSFAEAASIPEAAAASWMALMEKARLKPGERILIHGAAGGIGPLMVQLARAQGAIVYASASGEQKAALLAGLGAKVIDYKTLDIRAQIMAHTGGEGVDVIIDPLGAGAAEMHFSLLRSGGRLVTIGFLQGSRIQELSISAMLLKSLSWHAFSLRAQTLKAKASLIDSVRKQVLPRIATGAIVPVIDRCFTLADADLAHARMKERLHCGKILLEVQPLQEAAA